MIEFIDDYNAINIDEQCAFTYETIDKRREEHKPWSPLDVFEARPFVSRYDDWNVFPYGENNQLPLLIRNIVYSNSIAPGILNKKTQLNWGQGPKLYEEKFVNGTLVREYKDDLEVQEWLDSWDYEGYLAKCVTDYSHIESCYTKVILTKGWRIGSNQKVAKLEHIVPYRPLVVGKKFTPTHIILHKQDEPSEYEVYPMFDEQNPFKAGISIKYSNLYTFCSDFFSIPHILGSVPWIIQSSNVPKFLAALSKNAINIKYHITSPKEFWDAKREELKEKCTLENRDYKESMLKALRKKILTEIKEVLSGIENAGKFWHSERVLYVDGANFTELGWEINVIDQKMRDVVQSHIDIANKADASVATGIGIHSALGNLSHGGKSDTGSEQYYAYNNYVLSSIDLPERIVMKVINAALKINFPNKRLKMGFYHGTAKRQEEIAKKDRNKILDYGNE
ncbi:hypothetical protein [Riemerella anatipestifer]|uniref:hypothetical protein n=1 Tax=Riemerella anatipestifer TaxID=34085 RepID=UPI00208EAAF2|nr:hypothetical protein [Riemerella anatipestifer]MCO4303218.1 hypothetical protein [Riemerella anatipestifer]MCO7353630.1 hypothetical protein [Riemerella anatipestifer]MCQ4039008.1 hypothetical protein [Riemerella anatipestifer]MCT6759946.1 hypothetical protein [Riemerella anatipestifer]MCT6764189.1 hypothetical protein [Riemerella anatipestifer]